MQRTSNDRPCLSRKQKAPCGHSRYAGSGSSYLYLAEELCADCYAGMNRFAYGQTALVDEVRAAVDGYAYNASAASGETIRFSTASKYSYDNLTKKHNISMTILSGEDSSLKDRKSIINQAKKNAIEGVNGEPPAGRNDESGRLVVHVDDIDRDVVVGNTGLAHGLRRHFERSSDGIIPITVRVGEILKNSVQINEQEPRPNNNTNGRVLYGFAKSTDGKEYIVRFVVNSFSDELEEVEILKSN